MRPWLELRKFSGGDDAATGSGGCVTGEMGARTGIGKPNTSVAVMEESSGGDDAAAGLGGRVTGEMDSGTGIGKPATGSGGCVPGDMDGVTSSGSGSRRIHVFFFRCHSWTQKIALRWVGDV